MNKPTLGVIVGNRGFFPDHLAETGRKTILKVLEEEGINAVALTPEDSKFGSVENNTDAHKLADLFKAHRNEIDGVLLTLPNFGEERPIANTLRWAGLEVPVLVQATPDDATAMTIADRRDSFCGKMSACNNLYQYGIKYTLDHTPHGRSDQRKFPTRICAALSALPRGARFEGRAHRRHRRTADGLQHGALQREAPGADRHLGRYAGSIRSVWPRGALESRRCRAQDEARRSEGLRAVQNTPSESLIRIAKLAW